MTRDKDVLFFSYESDRRLSATEVIEAVGLHCVTAASLEEALAVVCWEPVNSAIIDSCVRHEDRRVLREECELVDIRVLDMSEPAQPCATGTQSPVC